MNSLPKLLLFPLLLPFMACGSDRAPDTASSAGSSTPPWIVEAKPPAKPPATANVTAHLDDKGVTISVSGKAVGTGCTGDAGVTIPVQPNGAHDFAAAGRCARKLKAEPRLADEASVTVTADWSSRYQDVVELLDALRTDSSGPIFPDFYFGVPRGAVATQPSPPASSPPSTASPPTTPSPQPGSTPGPREPLPVHVSAPSASQAEGTIMIVSKTQIIIGEEEKPIVTYSSLADLAPNGLDASHKRNGPNDLYVVPVAQALQRYRETDKKLREARGVDASTSELVLVADADVPYRVLFELLYTAGQSEFGKYQLMVRTGAR